MKARQVRRDAQAVVQARSTGKTVSAIWKSVRKHHGKRVRELIDTYIETGDSFSLRDLLMLELAAHEEMRDIMHAEPEEAKAITSTMLQSRRQLRQILTDIGEGGDVSTRPVRVPEGLRVLPSGDEGDDLLG